MRGLWRQTVLIAATAAALAAWLLLAAPGAEASCAEVEYTGPAGGSWQTEGNWSGGKVPTKLQTACIPSGKGTVEVPSGFTAEAKRLAAQSPLKIAATGTLAIAETAIGAGSESTFAGLDVEANAHLSTAGGWLFLTGEVLLEGEISRSKPVEALVRLLSGTLSGNGTIAVFFNNFGGTLQPGGTGVVGDLHFTMLSSQSAGGTLVLDLASGSSFDRMTDLTSNFFLGGTLEVNLLGGYDPPAKSSWEYMSGGPGDSTEFTAEPPGFTARSEPGGALLERLTAPPATVTEPASSVTQTTAVLNGTVNPNGSTVTSCRFELGQTTSYGSVLPCSPIASSGFTAVAVDAPDAGLAPSTTYHFRLFSGNASGQTEGVDRTFTTSAASVSEETPTKEASTGGGSTGAGSGGASSTSSTTSTSGGAITTGLASSVPGAIPVASTAAAVEALLLGCGTSRVVLNDAYINGSRVAIAGSAAKSLIGKKVRILFGLADKQVATATVGAGGEFATSAPLPPAKIREALSTRYTAEIGSERSLHLKLTRRLQLQPPTAPGSTVELTGQIELPLTKPIAPIVVEQQLECGKTAVVDRVTPPPSGRFRISLPAPAGAKAAIYTLKSSVAANRHSLIHGFTTYSLPLPVALG
ncbi:MAG TPA: hypothetical protein VK761_06720 [Solirubrobacteraceae bacterium]|jgi:hypothetical protein|nr:hypothetical protein [Solirubrobacteraceae bacterium]